MTIHDRNVGRVKTTGTLMQLSKVKAQQRKTGKKQVRAGSPAMRVIAIAGNKGGVGKTTIAANLGLSLSRKGKEVLILDGDLGMANLDIVFGVIPRYKLSHVIKGERTLSEALTEGPGNVKILTGSSGNEELTLLQNEQYANLLSAAALLSPAVDFLLIDTASGISPKG